MEEFEVAVIGAGPAGATAAYLLAKSGLSVLLIERGTYPGSKNVSGGLIYTEVLGQVYPGFWEEAPIERPITGHDIVLLGGDAAVALSFRKAAVESAAPPHNAYSVLRARFDPWLAGKAEAAGATLVTGVTVDKLVIENDRVVGVQAGPDRVAANVVVDAEGTRALLLRQARLIGPFHSGEVSLGIKEVIRLPEGTIHERFLCSRQTGTALTMIGHTLGVSGGGFLYTNRDSLSVGVVAKLDSLHRSGRRPHEILGEFKAHPFVSRLVEGGEVVEYSAQTVHQGGLHHSSTLCGDGYVVVGSAARLILNNLFTLRGMDLAVVSGVAAAQAVLEAHRRNDFSASALSVYRDYLRSTPVYQDMETFRGARSVLSNRRFFEIYPDLACAVTEELFAVHKTPSTKLFRILRDKAKGKVSGLDLVRDAAALARVLAI